jgi:hypothetical protein
MLASFSFPLRSPLQPVNLYPAIGDAVTFTSPGDPPVVSIVIHPFVAVDVRT